MTISPAEVAEAIHGEGKATKKRVESVRKALDEGRLVPGLRKPGKRWMVPIAALGAALDAKRLPESTDVSPGRRRSKQSTIGPAMLLRIERNRQMWSAVLHELAALEARDTAAELEKRWPTDGLAPDQPPKIF